MGPKRFLYGFTEVPIRFLRCFLVEHQPYFLLCFSIFELLIHTVFMKAVGCDLIVGSDKKVDSCGVCGGLNEQCSGDTFVWNEVALSHCSAPCGGGYMMARSVCQNNHTKATVADDLCNLSQKPSSRMAPCNLEACPARSVHFLSQVSRDDARLFKRSALMH